MPDIKGCHHLECVRFLIVNFKTDLVTNLNHTNLLNSENMNQSQPNSMGKYSR